MYFVIFATDKPGMEVVRTAVRPQHRVYLRNPGQHPVKALLGGPTLSRDQSTMNGTLLVIEAECIEHVEAFVHDDPYTAADIFERMYILPWYCGLGSPAGGAA